MHYSKALPIKELSSNLFALGVFLHQLAKHPLTPAPPTVYYIPAPLKNAIEWASRPPNAWADKAAAVVSTSGDFGGGRSQYHLRQIGVSLDLHFINKPEFFLDGLKSPEKFDSDGNLVDEQDKERLKEILLALQAFTLRLQTK
ncbi:NADPH:quinone oxidoreductase-like [Prunus avium]|uniref:NAD(P)H dehydrogenase (quinone) n=1 Tax=Prunus avium TaxID=42229 RepID=A0A6P5RPR8_PRUAV|nr:NADPH:quinone oxidoreductase-like [Prunus avium]